MTIIRIEGVSADPCSYAWYLGDVTLFLYGLIVGVIVTIALRLIFRVLDRPEVLP